jgi:hypothetical protein
VLDLRTQYVTGFGALPHVAIAAPHDGEFGPDEVARLGAARTPSVHVACMGIADLYEDGGPTAALLRWVAMVIARPADARRENEASAGDLAALVAIRIVHELRETVYAAQLERPARVRARNLYGSEAARAGYRLWGIEWQAPARIRPADLDPELNPFALHVTEYDFAPADGTIDTTTDAEIEHEEP